MSPAIILDNLDYLLIGAWPNGPVGGLALTVMMSALSAIASAVIGITLGIALSISSGWSRKGLRIVLGFFRAIPVLMLIFWTYFLLPILTGFRPPEIATVVAALSLIGGSYLAGTVSAGIDGIAQGQWQAGYALGLRRRQILRLIILPQALRAVVPSFVNQWATLIKDTSLAYIVGVPELSFLAAQVNNRAMVYPTEIFLFIGAIYWFLCVGTDRLTALVARTGQKV
ncbi:amino acid ABC transporter permease [Rhizobium lemnae]|uniref:Amino acid ABC transporter permease n=1 Tax=Rhizobium lemnae TaxID=1214924 RepID=A0ABV8E6I7_9HYPH|nr:amino acid ABC transporter permease [Rhizobium lemnae]MCJ8507711.1 amino acid ABC transporter permease [Rhizobium lemnae]